MNHFERFYATLERKPVDYPASWLGLPHEQACAGLLRHFGVENIDQLRLAIDDDLYPVELPYHSPTSNAIHAAFDFSKQADDTPNDRTLTTPGFFENYEDGGNVDDFNWPDPAKYINPAECAKVVQAAPADRPVLGVIWSAHFQDACAAFGMETALVRMITDPAIFRAVTQRIVRFYLAANEIFYKATQGKLDAVLIGNDLGTQTNLMISPDAIREFVLPGTRLLVEQAKNYGLKVMHHSCGAIAPIIPELIAMGVDVIHPIQARAAGMDAARLKVDFGNQITFCGGVDAQYLLVQQTPEDVKAAVRTLKEIFPTGLVISPSHEAILPDINPANIQALFEAVHER